MLQKYKTKSPWLTFVCKFTLILSLLQLNGLYAVRGSTFQIEGKRSSQKKIGRIAKEPRSHFLPLGFIYLELPQPPPPPSVREPLSPPPPEIVRKPPTKEYLEEILKKPLTEKELEDLKITQQKSEQANNEYNKKNQEIYEQKSKKILDFNQQLASLDSFRARIYQNLYEYDEAVRTIKNLLSEGKNLEDIGSATYYFSLLAEVCVFIGDYTTAEFLYTRNLAIREKQEGTKNLRVVGNLDDLASLYKTTGDYEKAESFLLRIVSIKKESLRERNPDITESDIADSLDDLASVYVLKGLNKEAENLYTEALTLRKKSIVTISHLSKDDISFQYDNYIASLENLISLFGSEGKYAKAVSLCKEAITSSKTIFGADSEEVSQLRDKLGRVYVSNGDYANAEILFKQNLETLGVTGLNNLAGIYQLRRNYGKAEQMYQRALSILKDEAQNYATLLTNLAGLYYEKKEYSKAESYYAQALDSYNRRKEESIKKRKELNVSAIISLEKGNAVQAINYQNRCNDAVDFDLARNLYSGSERHKLAYQNQTASYLDFTLSLHTHYAPNNLKAREMAMKVLFQRKGRTLDVMTETLAALRRRALPEDQKMLDQLSTLRSRLSTITLKGAGKERTENYKASIKALESEIETLESELSNRNAEFRLQTAPITIASVQAAIPTNAALIEFASFRSYDAKTHLYGSRRYAAYALTNTSEPVWADLGEAAQIESLVSRFRKLLRDKSSDTDKSLKPVARQLDELIMRPVRSLVGGVRRLFISPDGMLNLIPFAALVNEHNRYLVEDYSLSYLTSGRDLLRLKAHNPNKQSAIIIADPDFDKTIADDKNTANGDNRIAQRVANESNLDRIAQKVNDVPGPKLAGIQFRPLNRLVASANEANEIEATLPSATLLKQREATETALKQVSSPSILHIATHGFFLVDEDETQKEKVLNDKRLLIRVGSDGKNDDLPAGVKLENPLLKSGLFFAGANTGKSGDDDGVLTALEASGVDLYGTKLVVLSACDTGVGEVKNGEGVYGLRRAFLLSGSETQVMSLWSVSDQGTSELMIDYYKRLNAGEGRSEALRNVQLQMLRNPKRRHPFYWASFIQSGEWANLKGQR